MPDRVPAGMAVLMKPHVNIDGTEPCPGVHRYPDCDVNKPGPVIDQASVSPRTVVKSGHGPPKYLQNLPPCSVMNRRTWSLYNRRAEYVEDPPALAARNRAIVIRERRAGSKERVVLAGLKTFGYNSFPMTMDLFELKNRLDAEEKQRLSPRATLSPRAIRRRLDQTAARDHRQEFAIDVDRILHSLAYTRYIDKTQVFYLVRNDHITHRVLHVQLVSRISRTIGRHLGLNEDLIEAIALGHDLGHPPFGHDGETYLSRLCRQHGLGHFVHAVQSVEFLERIERGGGGLNLSLQVLDGILSHDGELDIPLLRPDPGLTFDDLDLRLREKKADPSFPLVPMTTEGCVVRLADTISYIGRDFEDAIRLGLIRREDMPADCARILGSTNGKIVYTLVSDLISTSLEKQVVAFSPEIAEILILLKNFNRERIYLNATVKTEADKIEAMFGIIFESLLEDLGSGKRRITMLAEYLDHMSPEYFAKHEPAEIVRDFVAGMTDEYFMRLGRELVLPQYRADGFS